jgi:hypothetical protein
MKDIELEDSDEVAVDNDDLEDRYGDINMIDV